MPWAKLDDQFYNHPKVAQLGPLMLPCVGLHVFALCWSNAYLTDGFIPEQQLSKLVGDLSVLLPEGDYPPLVAALVSSGLWEESEGGYQIHDFLEYNPSRRETLQLRKTRAQIGQAGGIASAKQKATKSQATRDQKSTPSPVPIPVPHKELSSPDGEEAAASLGGRNGFADWPPEWEPLKAKILSLPFLTRYQHWLTNLDTWKTEDEKFTSVQATLAELLTAAAAFCQRDGYVPRSRRGLWRKLHNCMEFEARRIEREGQRT